MKFKIFRFIVHYNVLIFVKLRSTIKRKYSKNNFSLHYLTKTSFRKLIFERIFVKKKFFKFFVSCVYEKSIHVTVQIENFRKEYNFYRKSLSLPNSDY